MAVQVNKYSAALVVLAVLALLLPGCGQEKQAEPVSEVKVAPTTKPNLSKGVVPVAGTVLEVVNADRFIYILLDRGENQIWATVPTVEVAVGEKVTLLNANVFNRFYSKSMRRLFEELVFASGIEGKESTKVASVSLKKDSDEQKPVTDSPSAK